MDILIKALQLIMSLSILVILHELGHYIPARLFKTKVEKFYLFFDPWFSLVKKKIGDTEYGIGWLPLGGYVKISGMIDESMDKEQMGRPPEKWEFRAKPAWQRLVIMLGGVTVNVLLAIFIYSIVLFTWGDKYVSNESLKNGVSCSDFAKDLGFKDGDKLISIDGEKVDIFYDIFGEKLKPAYFEMMIYNDDGYIVVVNRDGVDRSIIIGANFIKHWKDSGREPMFSAETIVKIADFTKNSNSEKAGLLRGDILLSIGDVETKSFNKLRGELQKNQSETVEVGVLRNNKNLVFPVEVSAEGMIGFVNSSSFETSIDSFDLASSFPAGYKLAKKELGGYLSGFALIFNSDNDLMGEVGGFGAIGGMFPSSWNWESFWYLTAFLSLMLAFLNILPIPALDGGHVAFLMYEIVVGKPAPEKFMEYAQVVGMLLLLTLVVLANGNDVLKLFEK